MRGRLLHSGILVVLLICLVWVQNTDETAAVGAPVVTIEFIEGEETQEADVRPGEHGTVTFPGTVTADLAAGETVQDVIVTLSADCDMGWPVDVNPDVVTVSPGDEVPFSVTVTVPPETSYYISATVTVGGTAQPYPGAALYTVAPVTGTIRIAQFFKFSLSCDEPMKNITCGSRCTYDVDIWNYGNGRDTYSIEVFNLQEVFQKGITVTLSANQIEVDEKGHEKFVVMVESPDSTKCIGMHSIELEIYSVDQAAQEASSFPKRYPLNLKIVEKSDKIDGTVIDNSDDSNTAGGEEEITSEPLPGFGAVFTIIALALLATLFKNKYVIK